MGKITVSSLQSGCKDLGIETSSKKAKELEGLIDEKLSEMELGYECPSCAKDIPDVKTCPYCGESFEEADEDAEAGGEDTGDEDAEAGEDADAEAGEDTEAGEDADAEAGDGDGEADPDKEIEKAASDVAKKVADKKSTKAVDKGKAKGKEEKKESGKKGRPEGTTVDTQKKNEEFAAFTAEIDELLGEDFEKRERKTGVTYVKDGKRLLKAVSTGKTLVVELNAEVSSDVDGITKYTEEEAKQKHLGTTKAIYDGGDTAVALKLIKEALKNFGK